jgi:GT2 family glycosyltransferase
VVLSYRNPTFIEKCVKKLTQSSIEADIAVQVIVVDNGAPETAVLLRRLIPEDVLLIENSRDHCFLKGNNGILASTGKYILI